METCSKFGTALAAFLWVTVTIASGQELRIYFSGIPGRDLRLDEYLYEAGSRLDCYFTIEELVKNEDQGGFLLYSQEILYPRLGHDIKKLVKHLNDNLAGFVAMQNETNSRVIHIIDKRLVRSEKYVMDSCATIDFKGRLPLLAKTIGDSVEGRIHIRRRGVTLGLESTRVDRTYVRVIGKNQRVRDLLTNSVPLSKYCRLIWQAEVYSTPKGLTAAIYYRGQPVSRPRHGDWWPVDSAIPFALGHPAYVNNSEEQIPAATAYIKEEMTAANPSQVRWAMLFLGKHKQEGSVPILLKYLDYRYTNCQVLEETYPAVCALIEIGDSAVAPVVQALSSEPSDNRRKLLCYSLLRIKGAKKGRELIEAVLTDVKDETHKKRLQLALTQAQTLFENNPNDQSE